LTAMSHRSTSRPPPLWFLFCQARRIAIPYIQRHRDEFFRVHCGRFLERRFVFRVVLRWRSLLHTDTSRRRTSVQLLPRNAAHVAHDGLDDPLPHF
jgi:hypothetical protein